jgi:hypothetical protein
MIIKTVDSLGYVSHKNTIDWLNIYFCRLCHHQKIQSKIQSWWWHNHILSQSIVFFCDTQPTESSIYIILSLVNLSQPLHFILLCSHLWNIADHCPFFFTMLSLVNLSQSPHFLFLCSHWSNLANHCPTRIPSIVVYYFLVLSWFIEHIWIHYVLISIHHSINTDVCSD